MATKNEYADWLRGGYEEWLFFAMKFRAIFPHKMFYGPNIFLIQIISIRLNFFSGDIPVCKVILPKILWHCVGRREDRCQFFSTKRIFRFWSLGWNIGDFVKIRQNLNLASKFSSRIDPRIWKIGHLIILFQYVYVRQYLRTWVEIENLLRGKKFRIYPLFVAKRRLSISGRQGPQSVIEFWARTSPVD